MIFTFYFVVTEKFCIFAYTHYIGIMELQVIQNKIYEIRGERVMLDRDLAELYNVPTKALNQAVKRNLERFPEDFMFQLNESEFANLRSQIVTSRWGGTRTMPLGYKTDDK